MLRSKKIILVAGARPNFMKIAPILRAIEHSNSENLGNGFLDPVLLHTGQHYDSNMSQSFFSDLGIKQPDYHLKCGGGTHSDQTARIMIEFEKICLKEKPDYVLVVGDVNSTIAAGLVAKKMQLSLIHVEAGLRSGDRNMPEEINRIATDAITDLFFTTELAGKENLLNEGKRVEDIHFVGHIMIDNLLYQLKNLNVNNLSDKVLNLKKALPEQYICMTLHRPSNVDSKEVLTKLLTTINEIAVEFPIIFPCHPRTLKKIELFKLEHLINNRNEKSKPTGLIVTEPLGYNDFLYLWKDCSVVLTDSGGLQEETTALQVPCITLRDNTERPVTVEKGTNVLVGNNIELLKNEVDRAMKNSVKKYEIPELWDGISSNRIIEEIKKVAFCI